MRTGWRDAGVFQRRELVGMQSQRALLSALNTSISVCRRQHMAIKKCPTQLFGVYMSTFLLKKKLPKMTR